MRLPKEEGYELTDKQLDQISGGSWNKESDPCPNGGSHDFVFHGRDIPTGSEIVRCTKCGTFDIR